MPVFVLTVLKVVFLLLLYFFVYRAVRTVALDLRVPARAERRAEGRARQASPPIRASQTASPKAKVPRSAVLLDQRGGKGRTYKLDGNLQIGRADGCDVQIDDTYMSSFHARLFSRDGAWLVEDLGSTNGTYVNQRRITSPSEVRAGDRVRFGKTEMELRR